MSKVIMLIGLPGSGKTSYAKKLVSKMRDRDDWKICSSDGVRRKLYGDEGIQGNPNTVFEHLHKEVKECLSNNINVIYDATNVSRKNRKNLIQICKSLGVEIEAHIVWATIDECIIRDKNRERSVGQSIIIKFAKRFEVPDLDEGFSEIHVEFTTGIDVSEYLSSLLTKMHISQDNSHHSLTVYKHCEKACDYLFSESYIIRQAAFLHDIGKPFCKSFKKGDLNAHYYNHDNVGAYLVMPILKSPQYTEFFSKEGLLLIIWLINNHMQPYFHSKYYNSLTGEKRVLLNKLHEADKAAH